MGDCVFESDTFEIRCKTHDRQRETIECIAALERERDELRELLVVADAFLVGTSTREELQESVDVRLGRGPKARKEAL